MDKSVILAMIIGSAIFLIILLRILFRHKEKVKQLKTRIEELQDKAEVLEQVLRDERSMVEKRFSNLNDLDAGIVRSELNDIMFVGDQKIREIEKTFESSRLMLPQRSINAMKKRFNEAVNQQYLYQYVSYLYPELSLEKLPYPQLMADRHYRLPHPDADQRLEAICTIVDRMNTINRGKEIALMQQRISFLNSLFSFDKSSAYISRLMADYQTYEIEILAKQLDWGYAEKRMTKVASIREIRSMARDAIEKSKRAEYSLAYLLSQFPELEKYIDVDDIENEDNNAPEDIFNDTASDSEAGNDDEVLRYIDKDEYRLMSETERNQLALDRYVQRRKTKWQIGRDYELFISYKYRQKGFSVDEFGSRAKLADLGRDLIAIKDNTTLIIQCKYWSQKKQIHEKHIFQLFGTVTMYSHHFIPGAVKVIGVLITNTELSDVAKTMANQLGIVYKEKVPAGDYPRIKCNVNNGERIYHLPFDQKYDDTVIKNKGEFYALTVKEAEDAGFRRAHRWLWQN